MDDLPDNPHRSRYGIEKLRDHNYQNWSFQCEMILSEKEVWEVVSGEHPCPKTDEQHDEENLTDAGRKKSRKNSTSGRRRTKSPSAFSPSLSPPSSKLQFSSLGPPKPRGTT